MSHVQPASWTGALVLATALFVTTVAEGTRRNFPTGQGWSNPSAATVYDDWDFNLCTNDYFYWGSPPLGRTHLGADAQGAGAWTTVRAMADGTIVRVETGWPGQSIGVVHHTSTGQAFMAVYGHLAGAPTSGTVTRGQSMGTTENLTAHLHLGIKPLTASEAASYVANGAPDIRGQGDTSCPSSSYGYVDPIPWLSAHSPGSAVQADPQVTVNPSLGETDPLTTFTFTASGFTPGGNITQTFYNPSGGEYGGAYTRSRSANSSGGFTGNPIWYWEPGDELGRYRGVFRDDASGLSDTLYFTIAEEPTPPSGPSCVPDDIGRITVSWASAGANGSAVSAYEVRSENQSTGAVAGWVGTGTARSRTYTGLPLGIPHRFRVRASNGAGTGGASALSAGCVPREAPEATSEIVALVDGDTLAVSWLPPVDNGAAVLEYDLVWEQNPGSAGSISTSGTSWIFTPPDPSAATRFQVAARNDAGWGLMSAWTDWLVVDPAPGLRIDDAWIVEGDSGMRSMLFDVTLLEPSVDPVLVRWRTRDLSAVAPADYRPDIGRLVLAPGQTTATLEVLVRGDRTSEHTEAFVVEAIKSDGASVEAARATGWILDDDEVPRLLPGSGEVVEGNSGVVILEVPVLLSAPSGRKVTVDWLLEDETAEVGTDVLAASGTLQIDPGEIEGRIEIQVLGDYEVEPDEWVRVTLSRPEGAELLPGQAAAFGVILDDSDTGATVPDAPGGLSAQSGLGGRVALAWTAPGFSGGPVIDGYEVQEQGSGSILAAAGTSTDWTGLSNGTSYSFAVRACNVVGCGAWSGTASATPYTVPGSPGTPSVSSQSNAVAVSWGSASSGGNSISRYELQHGSTIVHNGTSRSRTVSFGQDGSARTFRARACNSAGCGGWSGWSASVRPRTIQLSRGGAATYGYWYDTTVTGQPGWSTTLACNDGVDLSFWTQAITIPSSGVYRDSTLCYSGDLNPHWVNAGGLQSNRVSW